MIGMSVQLTVLPTHLFVIIMIGVPIVLPIWSAPHLWAVSNSGLFHLKVLTRRKLREKPSIIIIIMVMIIVIIMVVESLLRNR